jgi:hypothetical protein
LAQNTTTNNNITPSLSNLHIIGKEHRCKNSEDLVNGVAKKDAAAAVFLQYVLF